MFTFVLFLSFICSVNATSPILYNKPISGHPFNTLPTFSSFSPDPVIVKNYVRLEEDLKPRDLRGMFLLPGAASFRRTNATTNTDFCHGCDMLVTSPSARNTGKPWAVIELHGPARVFVLMAGSASQRIAERMDRDGLRVENLPEGWQEIPFPVEYTGSNSHMNSTDSDTKFSFASAQMETHAFAFEVDLQSAEDGSYSVTLPGPRTVLINGRPSRSYMVLFAKPGSQEDPIEPFGYSGVPEPFESLLNPGEIVMPTLPAPNTYCPGWLHDLYVTPNRMAAESADVDEPTYWRTWHPAVDPVYWCYFRHEHGDHPTQFYRPQFGYTAFKTPDDSTPDGRQNESHNGFKVVSFALNDADDSDDSRIVVLVFHIHLATPRRFSTRHHTVILAVLSEDGSLEVEIHLKMDYGSATVSLKSGRNLPIDDIQQALDDEMRSQRKRGSRRINIMNLNDFPKNVDPQYRLRDNPIPDSADKVRGVYELWRAMFPTCVDKTTREALIRLDVQDAGSAMRVAGEYDSLTWLNGHSVRRVVHMTEFTFSRELCVFNEMPLGSGEDNGVFYSDSYLSKMVDKDYEGGRSVVRQFIKNGFEAVRIPSGELRLGTVWCGPHTYDKGQHVKAVNVDNAVDKKMN